MPDTEAAASASRRGLPIPRVSPAVLACAVSRLLDLAEGRQEGHALRVAHVALATTRSLALSREERAGVLFGAVLHDLGAAHAGRVLPREQLGREDQVFQQAPLQLPHVVASRYPPHVGPSVRRALEEHAVAGADLAQRFGAPRQAVAAILGHHEHWDGTGYPQGRRGTDTEPVARIVGMADVVESYLALHGNPLAARQGLNDFLLQQRGNWFDPSLADILIEATRADLFWWDLHATESASLLLAEAGLVDQKPLDLDALEAAAAALAEAVDARTGHLHGYGAAAARLADGIARRAGVDGERARLVYLAGLLHDIGALALSGRLLFKVDVLTVEELEQMQRHPTVARDLLETLPGMGEIARWIGQHHERVDGRGYPDGLEGDALALEARILALADVYCALRSDRPYRRALGRADALDVIRGLSGTHLDPALVHTFLRATDLHEPLSE